LAFEGIGCILIRVALALELVDPVVLRHLVVMDNMPATEQNSNKIIIGGLFEVFYRPHTVVLWILVLK
jgi:hypothetical protein